MNRLIERYDFIEGEDFLTITQKRVTAQGNETIFSDHQLTISTAKEISMEEAGKNV